MNTLDNTRILPIKGGYNFRDLGGITTKEGRTIKKDLLFRTDELSNLLPEEYVNLKTNEIADLVKSRIKAELDIYQK